MGFRLLRDPCVVLEPKVVEPAGWTISVVRHIKQAVEVRIRIHFNAGRDRVIGNGALDHDLGHGTPPFLLHYAGATRVSFDVNQFSKRLRRLAIMSVGRCACRDPGNFPNRDGAFQNPSAGIV